MATLARKIITFQTDKIIGVTEICYDAVLWQDSYTPFRKTWDVDSVNAMLNGVSVWCNLSEEEQHIIWNLSFQHQTENQNHDASN